MAKHHVHRVAQTEGRSWDGNLQVYNNPIPTGWLLGLLATALFALVYWLLYPSWPGPQGVYPGFLEVELKTIDGKVTVPWSSRAELAAHAEQDPVRIKQRWLLSGIASSSYHGLINDANMLDFALAGARAPYLDYCANCHGANGRGMPGLGTDLVDGDWRGDADFSSVEAQVRSAVDGGHGSAQIAATGTTAPPPDWRKPLSAEQVKMLTVYVHELGK
jgi:cytochrome c oxidase cbb3-type subunit 3